MSFPTKYGEPPFVLRSFRKVNLAKGAVTDVTFTLAQRDFSWWETGKHAWALATGEFTIAVGASSRDLRLRAPVQIN